MLSLYNTVPFGEQIIKRMQELGWTKADLARRLKVTPSRIHALLRQPSMSEIVFRKAMYVLGVSVELREVCRPTPPRFVVPKNRRMDVEGEYVPQ